MPDPIDLTEKFGEGWCVTVTRLPPGEALHRMGVAELATMPDGLQQATGRLAVPGAPRDLGALILGRQAAAEWTLVLELDGTHGWLGREPDVLAALSTDSGIACSTTKDSNQTTVLFAEDGLISTVLDAVTGSWRGTPSHRLATAFADIGLREDDEPSDAYASRSCSQNAALVIRAATGITLGDDMFTGSWIGGLAASE
ncbi:DUF6461 domain-containing protein [Streptomyces sp. bgisy034]|uniref:DUF6461 domain-containing protein n=1 Tax=Streptomyces sp. bgisy034 TaxID=3413774 RepID=UPI003EBEEBAE